MKTNKKLALITFLLLVIDLCHFIIFRLNPDYTYNTEVFYEDFNVSLFKWLIGFAILMNLMIVRNKKISGIILILLSVFLVTLSIIEGPLFKMFMLYNEASSWIIIAYGVYLIYFSLKFLIKKDRNSSSW